MTIQNHYQSLRVLGFTRCNLSITYMEFHSVTFDIKSKGMYQPIKSHGQKLISICKKVHCTNPCIHLGHPKGKLNINISLLNLPPAPSPIPTNITNYNISKPLQNLPHLILIKHTQCLPTIQILYYFWNHINPQRLLPTSNNFNSRQNYHMGGDACEVRFPINHILWMLYYC